MGVAVPPLTRAISMWGVSIKPKPQLVIEGFFPQTGGYPFTPRRSWSEDFWKKHVTSPSATQLNHHQGPN